MGQFHTRRIRQKTPLQLFQKTKEVFSGMRGRVGGLGPNTKRLAISGVLMLVGVLVVLKVTLGLYQSVKEFDLTTFASQSVASLRQDENGYINLILLGDGGHERDGADLVDTIMVVSVDPATKSVSLLSIPRDYYVRTEGLRHGKINELYRDYKAEMGGEAYSMFAKAASDMTGLDIPYYVRVDFSAFVEVVDSLGGITVDVQDSLYDPYYPNETDDGYTVFSVDAGPQEMNGETALKFARSRKTTSDFDRAARQQLVLAAIKEKAMSADVLTSPTRIKKLYSAVSKNLNTNLSFPELLSLGALAKGIDRSKMVSKVIHDDPTREGGFLYTPERKYYNGQFVLVPDGDNLDLIRQFADLIFNHRDIYLNPAKVEVLNGTKEPGIARSRADRLKRFGFDIINIENLADKTGNRKTVEKGFIRYNQWETDKDGNVIPMSQSTVEALSGLVKGEPLPSDELVPNPSADISVVLGEDYGS